MSAHLRRIRELQRLLGAEWTVVDRRKSISLTHPRVVGALHVSCTPSDRRELMNVRAEARRAVRTGTVHKRGENGCE